MKRIYIPLLFLFLCPNFINATVFNAIADGNWNEPTIWDQGSVPGSLDTVIIDGYIVTINDVTGNVAVKHLVLTNASNVGFSQLIIMEAVTVIVIDDLEATAENINQDVEVLIQDNATMNVNGNVNFTRVNTNNHASKLMLHLQNASRLNVSGSFTYDYKNANIGENRIEIKLENSAILDVTGNTALYMSGGKKLTFINRDSAQAFLRGNLDVQISSGDEIFIHNTGVLTIGDKLTMNSTVVDKIMQFRMGLNCVFKVTGDVSMNALSEGDVYIDLKSTSNMFIGGDFLRPTNYGALLMEATSTLTYNGTQPQVLAADNLTGSGTDAFNFTNVVLDNSSGFSLAATMSIANNFNLTNGIITTNSANILVIGDSATITGGDASNYVDGPMIKEGRTVGDRFVFPIGDGSLYAPIGISKISTSSSQYTAQAFGDPPPFGTNIASDVGTISGYQYWELTKTPGSDDVDVTLNWMDAAANGINNLDSIIVVGLNESNIWENFGNGRTSGGTGSGVAGSVSSTDGDPPPFGVTKFTVGSLPPVAPKIILPSNNLNGANGAIELLPVELTRFYAFLQKDKVYLGWQTASEINTSHFVVECTMNGRDFKEVGTIMSKGESNFIQNYSTFDDSPSSGVNCYRLKIVDRDGWYEYSPIVAVNIVKPQALSIYPNPVNEVLHLKGGNFLTDEGILEVFGINGQLIYTGKCVLESGSFQIATNKINVHLPGTYFVRFTNKSGSHVLKFNKH